MATRKAAARHIRKEASISADVWHSPNSMSTGAIGLVIPLGDCQTDSMAERTMSDEHKAAIAAGRIGAAAVRDYLDALESSRPKRARQVTPEKLQERRADINSQLGSVNIKPIKRLELMQQRRDIDAQFTAIADEPDMSAVEAGFVEHAPNYGQRKGITCAT